MKRTIIVALILILLSSLLPSGAMAATYSNKADFLSYLDSQGIPGINRSGREANYHTYNKYNLVVYGDPWGDSKPSSICPSIQGTQTRYLGP